MLSTQWESTVLVEFAHGCSCRFRSGTVQVPTLQHFSFVLTLTKKLKYLLTKCVFKAWGLSSAKHGRSAEVVQEQLQNVTSIQSTAGAFAALRAAWSRLVFIIWEFPTIGGPNMDPEIVGLLL